MDGGGLELFGREGGVKGRVFVVGEWQKGLRRIVMVKGCAET
jgi:hypothetical protein